MALTKQQLELKAHIESKNAKHGFSTNSDPLYQAEHNIFTVAEFEHSEAVTAYTEAVKESTGFKPRNVDFSRFTTQQLRAMAYAIDHEDEIAEERAAEVRARNIIPPNRPFAGLKLMLESA